MKPRLVRETTIDKLPDAAFRVTAPVKVEIYKEADASFSAVAPELGMWVHGIGATEQSAVSDLMDAIVDQRLSVGRVANSGCSEYAMTIKAVFENRFVED